MTISRTAIFLVSAVLVATATAQGPTIDVVGDGIPKSLTGKAGDPARGRALIVKRGVANCLTCHSIKDRQMQPGGNSATSLDRVGAVLTAPQLRLTLVDYARITRSSSAASAHSRAGFDGDAPTRAAGGGGGG